MKKLMSIAYLVVAGAISFSATPEVTDVVAKQRYPWNGLVDITCKVTGISGTDQWKFAVAAVMPDSGDVRKASHFWVVQDGTNSTDHTVHVDGVGSNKWFRLTIKKTYGGGIMQLSEFGLYAQDGSRQNLNLAAMSYGTPAQNLSPGTFCKAANYAAGKDTEEADNLFDGNTETKWCATKVSMGNPADVDTWRTITMRLADTAKPIHSYNFCSANDSTPDRNPVSWLLESSDNGIAWRTVAEVDDNPNTATVTFSWFNGGTPYIMETDIYHLLWDAKADLGQVTYDNMVMRVTVIDHDMVQLWEGGPYWADTNIGAENPEDYGYYFWWGDTVGYKREDNKWVATDGSSSNFSFSSSNTPTYGKYIATLKSEGWITAEKVLAPEHDAAHVHWGGAWRMPTGQELSDLNSKCDWTWTTVNGVKGYVVKGKGLYASASIFLPCAGDGYGASLNSAGSIGYYWSSVPYSGSYDYAWGLRFHSGGHDTRSYDDRDYGQSVRPVQGFTE